MNLNAEPSIAMRLMTMGGALALATIFVALLVAAPSASAQQPAICDRYPNLPQCQGPTDDEGTTDDGLNNPGPAGSGEAAGGLPFTGYPMTFLILLLLALLLLGLAIRVYLAARDRVAGNRQNAA